MVSVDSKSPRRAAPPLPNSVGGMWGRKQPMSEADCCSARQRYWTVRDRDDRSVGRSVFLFCGVKLIWGGSVSMVMDVVKQGYWHGRGLILEHY